LVSPDHFPISNGTPLTLPSREFKVMDGLANPYFATGSIILAGVKGVTDKEKLTWGDCELDPASLTENDKAELGISKKLPLSIEEALRALQDDKELVELVGSDLVERYVAIKDAERNMLGEMGEEERRQWMIERY
jgi:glutamine synthetase